MADSKELGTTSRRISIITNHIIPIGLCPTRVDSVELCIASSMDDSFHKVHGEVLTHDVVWKKADFFGDGDNKEFVDIIYEKALDEGIAKITINRPERRNAFRPQTVKELMRAFNDARDDGCVGVIILTGKGTKEFCSGGDQALRTPDGYTDPNDVGRLNVLDLQVQIRRLPKPVIVMVNTFKQLLVYSMHLCIDPGSTSSVSVHIPCVLKGASEARLGARHSGAVDGEPCADEARLCLEGVRFLAPVPEARSGERRAYVKPR